MFRCLWKVAGVDNLFHFDNEKVKTKKCETYVLPRGSNNNTWYRLVGVLFFPSSSVVVLRKKLLLLLCPHWVRACVILVSDASTVSVRQLPYSILTVLSVLLCWERLYVGQVSRYILAGGGGRG